MFVLGNFLIALAGLLNLVLSIMYWLILVRVLISWVNPDPFNAIVQFLYRVTEPVLEPLRRIIPPLGMIDISPIVAFLALVFLKSFLVSTIYEMGFRLKMG